MWSCCWSYKGNLPKLLSVFGPLKSDICVLHYPVQLIHLYVELTLLTSWFGFINFDYSYTFTLWFFKSFDYLELDQYQVDDYFSEL